MKNVQLTLLLVLMLMLWTNVDAQSLKVFKKDGTTIVVPYAELDSIVAVAEEETKVEAVDLGLPSGLKWATCNLGATTPEGYGDFYAWGEIKTKDEYTVANSETTGVKMKDYSGDAKYDVARAILGGTWRTPTKAEMQELLDNCIWTWTEQNETVGMLVTGPNGSSIFFPTPGCRMGKKQLYEGQNSYYWSSTPDENNNDYAFYLTFNCYDFHDVTYYYRDFGMNIRPVGE